MSAWIATCKRHQEQPSKSCVSKMFFKHICLKLPGIDKFIYTVKLKLVSLLLCSLFFSLATICDTSTCIVVKFLNEMVPSENYWSSIFYFLFLFLFVCLFFFLRKSSKTWPQPEFYQIMFYSLITWFAYGTGEMPFSFMVSNFPPFRFFSSVLKRKFMLPFVKR